MLIRANGRIVRCYMGRLYLNLETEAIWNQEVHVIGNLSSVVVMNTGKSLLVGLFGSKYIVSRLCKRTTREQSNQ